MPVSRENAIEEGREQRRWREEEDGKAPEFPRMPLIIARTPLWRRHFLHHDTSLSHAMSSPDMAQEEGCVLAEPTFSLPDFDSSSPYTSLETA